MNINSQSLFKTELFNNPIIENDPFDAILQMEKLLSTITGLCFDFDLISGKETQMSDFSPICQILHTSQIGKEACQRCSKMAVDDCLNSKAPVIVKCHLGFIDAYVPIVSHEQVLGILTCGQFLFEAPTNLFYSYLHQKLMQFDLFISVDVLKSFSIPVCPEEKFRALTMLMTGFSSFLSIAERHNEEIKLESSLNPLDRAKFLIEKHYAEPITIQDLSQLCNISVSRLSHLFKQMTGYTFTEYLNNIRIYKAKNLLINSHLPISEVSLQVGFSTISHFNHLFREIFKMSPSDIRKHDKTRS